MEKNSNLNFKHENSTPTTTVCEKLKSVIQTTSPFRAIRFASNNQVHQESSPARNVSLMTRTPARDRCTRTPVRDPTPLRDWCPRRPIENTRESDQTVPIIFRQSEDHSNGSGKPMTRTNKPKANNASSSIPQAKADVLPIHGFEHRVPSMSHIGEKSSIAESVNGLFTEYIDRAGRKIRSPTMVGATNNMKHDSFNDKVSDFINRAKHKFHSTPSLVDSSFKEKRLK